MASLTLANRVVGAPRQGHEVGLPPLAVYPPYVLLFNKRSGVEVTTR